ncbi:FAD-dependent oxidoreductase [uncultured Enterovirga sp.]|uniref:FAD-dependent oxidoreductase n=1 Tax=uncultured Enterovirga sp. TaxID=2026352 RepID=UPI0035CA9132
MGGETRQSGPDVIVVGGGGAGLAAAIAAAEAGAKVLLCEKNPELGGSTAWSVGSVSATGTPHQLARGIRDTPDEHYDDLEILAGRYANRDNRELRRLLVDRTQEMMAWLDSLGIVFVGPNVEPPHRHPRMHNVVPNSRAFPLALGARCRQLGVEIRLATRVLSLLTDDDRIAGVEIAGPGGRREPIRARRGVILAAGDYSASPELKRRFAGPETADLEPVNATATGDGFGLGTDAGGTVINGDIVRGPIMRFVPPTSPSLIGRLPPSRALGRLMKWSFEHLPAAILRPFAMRFLTTALGPSAELFRQGAVLVDRGGRRFADEVAGAAGSVPQRPGGEAFILFDATVADQFTAWPYFISTAPGVAYAYLDDYRRTRGDIYHSAPTLDALATALGVPGQALADSVAAYNAGGRRNPDGAIRPVIARPPFVALGPVKSYVVFTDGGLKVNTKLQVLDGSDLPIPGLWAAGSNGQGGVLLEGHGHHLGWAFISGRIAGREAARAEAAADNGQAQAA